MKSKIKNYTGSSIKARWIKSILLVFTAIMFLFSCIIIKNKKEKSGLYKTKGAAKSDKAEN